MQKVIIFLILLVANQAFSQRDSVNEVNEINKFQQALNDEYRDATKSPLTKDDRARFSAHEFFPVNLKFRVVATLRVTANTPFFQMKTTSIRASEERIYGYVEFSLDGNRLRLPVYQSSRLLKTQEYSDYLFFPFTDLTNGAESYHGGRYIDLRIPVGEEIIIDFNKAYNPYCAYATGFSCPIVPKENHIDIRITAGIKYREKK